jgi:hypothetical protein
MEDFDDEAVENEVAEQERQRLMHRVSIIADRFTKLVEEVDEDDPLAAAAVLGRKLMADKKEHKKKIAKRRLSSYESQKVVVLRLAPPSPSKTAGTTDSPLPVCRRFAISQCLPLPPMSAALPTLTETNTTPRLKQKRFPHWAPNTHRLK